MKINELREKSDIELDKALVETHSKLQDQRFAVAGRRLKLVREMREAKKTVARIMTLKKQRAASLASDAAGSEKPKAESAKPEAEGGEQKAA